MNKIKKNIRYRLRAALLTGAIILCGPGQLRLHADEERLATERLQYEFPKVNNYHVLAGDFHAHTLFSVSCGRIPVRERVVEAWEYGYDVFAITDHGNHDAYDEALPIAEELGLIMIRGLESGMFDNHRFRREHYVILGISSDYVPRNPHAWAQGPGGEHVFFQDQMRHVKETGGLAFYAHPHVESMSSLKNMREFTLWGIEHGVIQGIEVKNGGVDGRWGSVESHGTWCYPFAFDWALEHDLAVFANSDIHWPRNKDENQPVTLVMVEERTANGVMEAIRARRTIAWFNDMLWGREALLTELVQGIVETQHIDEGNGRHTVRLYNNSPVVLKIKMSQQAETVVVTLEPYSDIMMEDVEITKGTLAVHWDNLWITPRDRLVTHHDTQH